VVSSRVTHTHKTAQPSTAALLFIVMRDAGCRKCSLTCAESWHVYTTMVCLYDQMWVFTLLMSNNGKIHTYVGFSLQSSL